MRDAPGSNQAAELRGRATQLRVRIELWDQVDRLTVTWPGGEKQVFTGLAANRTYRIVQGTPEPKPLDPD